MTDTIDIIHDDISFSVTYFYDKGIPGGAPDDRFEVEKIELRGADITNVISETTRTEITEKTWEVINKG